MAQTINFFTGTDDVNFDEFLVQFKLIAAINKWAENDLALILGAYLQGPALSFFKNLYTEGIAFKTICDKIKEEFPSITNYVEKFYSSRQNKDEDLIMFYYRLNDLSMKAQINDESIFIKTYLKGLTNENLQKLGTRVYNSKAELRMTLIQIKELFGQDQKSSINLPIQPPRGILSKVRFDHPFEITRSPSTSTPRAQSPTPSPSTSTPRPMEPRNTETFHTPRYNLRPRFRFTNTNSNNARFFSSPRSRDDNPNYQGRRH